MPALVDSRTTPTAAPVIAYLNRAFDGSWSATSQAVGFAPLSARTYATYEGWRPASASASITSVYPVAYPTDYIGCVVIGAQDGATITAQYSTDGATFVTVGDAVNATAGTILWLFDEVATARSIRLVVSGGNVEGFRLAVLMAGLKTELQRNIYVGHTPINYGRETLLASNQSENGQFLGRIIRRESIGTSVSLQNLTASYYRQSLDPVFVAMKSQPVFWAWRPSSETSESGSLGTEDGNELGTEDGNILGLEEQSGIFSSDVAYAWLQGSPSVVNQRPNGMMQASFSLASGDFTL